MRLSNTHYAPVEKQMTYWLVLGKWADNFIFKKYFFIDHPNPLHSTTPL